MGIFGRFFKKKQEIVEENICLAKLPVWYDEKTQSKKKKLKRKIDQTKQKIIQITQETNQKIHKLQNAKLMNPNIPERAKHFLHGNKEAYVKKMNSFLESLTLPEEVEELEGFFKDFSVQIQGLAQGIARPTQILNEFMANETRAVTLVMGAIEKEIEKLKEETKKTGLLKLEETKNKITEIFNKQDKEDELKKELSAIQKEIDTMQKENDNLKKEIELLKKDKELNQALERKKEVQEKIEQMKKELLESFSIIETALKKYEHITFKHKEIAGGYLESPIDALMKDLHLEILQTFSDLRNSIKAGKIEMKKRKTKKTLDELKKLDKEKLGRFLTEYGQLYSEKRRIKEKVEQMDVIKAQKEKEKRLLKNENKLTALMSRMNYVQIEFDKIDINKIIKEVEEELNTQFNMSIKISEEPSVQASPYLEQTQ